MLSFFKNKKIKSIVYATSVLAGTIIGVALFSLPYLTLQVGWPIMLAYFIVLGGLMILLHVLFGELVINTPDKKRFPGIAEYYWGKKGKYLAFFTHSGSLIGAILAYILVGGGFLFELLSGLQIDISLTGAILIFWFAGSLIMFLGSGALNKLQLLGIISFIFILVFLAWLGKGESSITNLLARNGDNVSLLAPYGALVFALWGASLIPQIEDILVENKKYMKGVIIASVILPIIVYLFFIAIVMSISGVETTPLALTSLSEKLGQGAYFLILIFGIITTFTSFTAIGLTMTQVFEYDLKIKRIISWLVTILLPIFLYFIGVKDFLELIVFVGSVLLAIDGINMLLMYRKNMLNVSKWKKFGSIVLILVLLGGIIYELLYLFK
ncbi:MAG: aromatic amino acid transport family protein [Candidatus Paceibacterota bacterium]|jgi:amino acid permease